jgi:hypothetical protein
MNKGKRYGVSLLGLLLLIGGGSAQAAPNRPISQPEQQSTPSAPVVIQQEQTATDYYEGELRAPQGPRCCRSLRAAAHGSGCGRFSMVVAGSSLARWLGLRGILVTLVFSGLGTRAAARQVRLSRDALIHTDRAFVYPFQTMWNAVKDVNTDKVRSWRMSIRWKNSGNTPTRHLRMWTNLSVRTDTLLSDFDFPDEGAGDIPTLIAPQATVDTQELELSLDDLELAIAGKRHLYAWGWAEYDDVFDRTRRHRTEFCYKINVGGNPRDPNKMTFRWITHDRYNGADEECETPLKATSSKDMGDK